MEKIFKQEIKLAVDIAQSSGAIVAIGIKPTYSNPSFGYLLPSTGTGKYHSVLKFVEKPSVMDAMVLINKGSYWNSGIYTFPAETMLNEFSLYQPEYFKIYQKLVDSLGHEIKIKKLYQLAENLPLDKAISEKTKRLVFIPAGFKWSDVGEWHAILELIKKDNNLNALLQGSGPYLSVNSHNCLVSVPKHKLAGIVGVSGLAIIDTSDALLICNLKDSFSVRDLVGQIVSKPELKKYFIKNDQR